MPSSTDGDEPTHWGCRALRPDGTIAAFYGVRSSVHDDRLIIDLREDEVAAAVGTDVVTVLRFDDKGVLNGLEVMPSEAPKLPPVWWAELPEPDGRPPAINLLAFVGGDVEPGTLLTREQLRLVRVTSEDQLGAVRWYPATGEVDQVYVAPQSRRRSLATGLIAGGSTLQAWRDLPRLWSDGQRTSDGNRFVSARPEWSPRVGELTHLAPPMTPFDQR